MCESEAPFEPQPGEIAGFDLFAYRQPDGTIRLGTPEGREFPDFPAEITLCGNTYTLEEVRPQKNSNVEWGVYA